MSPRTAARCIVVCVLLLLGPADAGAVQTLTMIEDGEFLFWGTVASCPPDPALVSAGRESSGGNPGAHYRVTHLHDQGGDCFGGAHQFVTVRSHSVSAQSFSVPAGSWSTVQIEFDYQTEKIGAPFRDDIVGFRALIVQGGRAFLRQLIDCGHSFPEPYRRCFGAIGVHNFRAEDGSRPDFSPDTPPLFFGLEITSHANGPSSVLTRIDNLTARLIGEPAPVEGPDLAVTAWPDKTPVNSGDLLRFLVQVRNAGTVELRHVQIFAPYGSFAFRTDDPACFDVNGGWDNSSSARARFRRIGSLAPGTGTTVELCGRVDFDPSPYSDSLAQDFKGTIFEPYIFYEPNIRNNRVTVVVPRAPGCRAEGSAAPDNPCCTMIELYCSVANTDLCGGNLIAASSEPRGLLARIGLGVRRFLDTAADVVTLYRVRERLQMTPGGRRVVELYYGHDPEMRELVLESAALRELALDGLDAWGDSLRAFADREGEDVRVTGAQLDALQAFLDAVRPLASPALLADLEQAEADLDLRSLEGLDVERAFVALDALVSPRPDGPALTSSEVPGFAFQVRITAQDGSVVPGVAEPVCIPETLCVSGALAGRSEVFLRVVGPKPNGFLWPTLVKFSTSTVEIWAEQLDTGLVRYYRLEGAAPGRDELPGLFDRTGFVPLLAPAPARGTEDRDAPPPPAAVGFTSADFPDFRFHVRILNQSGESQPVRQEEVCIPETLCVSGALPGRSEVFLRVVGPKPNGRLWPTLVRFTTSTVEVWIEQLSSGAVRYYRLEGASPGVDDLTGLFDREGFLP